VWSQGEKLKELAESYHNGGAWGSIWWSAWILPILNEFRFRSGF